MKDDILLFAIMVHYSGAISVNQIEKTGLIFILCNRQSAKYEYYEYPENKRTAADSNAHAPCRIVGM